MGRYEIHARTAKQARKQVKLMHPYEKITSVQVVPKTYIVYTRKA